MIILKFNYKKLTELIRSFFLRKNIASLQSLLIAVGDQKLRKLYKLYKLLSLKI